MKSNILALPLLLSIFGGLHADAILKVTSEEKAQITIDGEDLGTTPLLIRDLKPGRYEVKAENLRTGEIQTFAYKAPKIGTVEKTMSFTWKQAAALQPSATEAIHAAAPAPTEEEIAAQEAQAVKQKNKKIVRTAALGGLLANEIFMKKGKTKDTLRKVAGGAALINEIR